MSNRYLKEDFCKSVWFVCKYCKRAFQLSGDLITHKKQMHMQEFRRDKKNKMKSHFGTSVQKERRKFPRRKSSLKPRHTSPSTSITLGISTNPDGSGCTASLSLSFSNSQNKEAIVVNTSSCGLTAKSSDCLDSKAHTIIYALPSTSAGALKSSNDDNSSNTNDFKTHYEFRCKYCTKECATKCGLVAHVKAHNAENNRDNRRKNCNDRRNMEGEDEQYLFKCSKCMSGFRVAADRRQHQSRKHSFRCEFCPRTYIDKQMLNDHNATHAKISQTTKHPLELDKQLVRSDQMMSQDKKSVSELKTLELSGKPEDDVTNLINIKHAGAPDSLDYHDCNYCDEVFSSLMYLNLHVQKAHTSVSSSTSKNYCSETMDTKCSISLTPSTTDSIKQYKCFFSECGKTFENLQSLNNHCASHYSVNSKMCPVCGIIFYSASNCRRHQARHLSKCSTTN